MNGDFVKSKAKDEQEKVRTPASAAAAPVKARNKF